MDLLQQFTAFIKKENLFQPKAKILLAVSGGVDSVVMTELFHRAQFRFALAHCNFQLRGKESDADEKFVQALAKKYNVTFYSQKFSAMAFAKKNKLSIQEAARNLRYDWFQQVAGDHRYEFTATAHHLNDSIETFFINLLRGTGISGLTGILSLTDDGIIRPLLFASRKDIERFAKENKLKFREDRSNLHDEYLRNKMRHHLIPVFEKLSPSFEKTMARNLSNLQFAGYIFEKAMIEEMVRLTRHVNGLPYFSRKELKRLDFPANYLYEFLSPFGFNASQVQEIWDCKQSGKVFYSDHFRVTCDRDKIIFALQQKQDENVYPVKATQKKFSHKNFSLHFSNVLLKDSKKFTPPSDKEISCLDASLLNFPLEIRKWKAGDFFYPLGMKHRKKLSDFLVDNKFSVPEKENLYVLLSGNDIVTILGHRIDDRYKITGRSKKVFRIDYLSNLK